MCIAKKHPKNAESERPNGAKAKTDHPNVPVAPSSSNPDEEPTNFESNDNKSVITKLSTTKRAMNKPLDSSEERIGNKKRPQKPCTAATKCKVPPTSTINISSEFRTRTMTHDTNNSQDMHAK